MFTYYFPDPQCKPFIIIILFREALVRYQPSGDLKYMFKILQDKASAIAANYANGE